MTNRYSIMYMYMYMHRKIPTKNISPLAIQSTFKQKDLHYKQWGEVHISHHTQRRVYTINFTYSMKLYTTPHTKEGGVHNIHHTEGDVHHACHTEEGVLTPQRRRWCTLHNHMEVCVYYTHKRGHCTLQRGWCTLCTPHRGELCTLHTLHIARCTQHIEKGGVYYIPHTKKGSIHYTMHTDVHYMPHTENVRIDYTPYTGDEVYTTCSTKRMIVYTTHHK